MRPLSRIPDHGAASPHGWPRSKAGGIICILIAAFCFGLMPVFSRAIVDFSAINIVFFRAAIAGITLSIILGRSPAGRAAVDLRRLDGRTRLLVLVMGVAMAGSSVLYFYALQHTTVAKAILLNYTGPIYVALLGPRLLREASQRYAPIAVPLGLAGMVLIIEPARLASFSPGELSGIIAGVFSGVAFAGIFLLGRWLAPAIPSMARAMLGISVVALLLLPWGVTVPLDLLRINLPWLLALGLIGSAIPFTLLFRGQEFVSAQVASMISLFEPVCGIIIGYVVFSEHLTILGLAGAAGILISIYLSSL